MDLPTAFRAVLNEYYVLESSKKVRDSCVSRIRKGEFIGSLPYGYILKDRFTPIIDEEKAKIVCEIFSLYLEKKNYVAVAGILNERQIPPPTIRTSKWVANTIHRILKNEKYTGKRVTLKYRKDLKTKKNISNDKSEWYINEHAFPPIISLEIFEQVQELMPKGRSYSKSSETHIMARKLYCFSCGKALQKSGNFHCKNGYQTGERPCFEGYPEASLCCR